MKLTHHWVADIFPLNESDVDRLADDIKANGQRNPIIVLDGAIIDGRTRFAACKKLGVEPITVEYAPKNGEITDDELLALSWSLNEARRHLTTSQRACAAAEVMERAPDRRTKGGKAIPQKGKSKSIEHFEVGKGTVDRALEILRDNPSLFAQVKAGELTVGAAHEVLRKTKELGKAETARNSIAEIRSKDEDLAEQVENGQLSIDEAQQKISKDLAAKRERTSNLAKVATGLFVSVAGIQSVEEAIEELKTSIPEIVATRQAHQLKEDARRLTRAIDTLTAFIGATKERK